MERVTEERPVEGEVSIWVIPERDWIDGEYKYTGQWDYQLRTDHCYDKGAVKVTTQKVTLYCEGGHNLIEKAVSTLQDAVEEERARHHQAMAELQSQINQLLMLTYQPAEQTL